MHLKKNGGSMELSELSGVGEVLCKLSSSPPTFKLEELELTSRCPYGILPMEFMKVGEIHIFFGLFTKMVQCKGFAYGDLKNQLAREAHMASIQHGGLTSCNIGNTRCHHYKRM
jgi:hypothetical protein